MSKVTHHVVSTPYGEKLFSSLCGRVCWTWWPRYPFFLRQEAQREQWYYDACQSARRFNEGVLSGGTK